ncbi:alpha/beta fold hydrolase [Sphingomonas japonica]|uniref:Pimeloyl-ACP methyl ester carboxylesterase n=1 Tax=Sphingomonas japonica TaxID=511662 RepID=A0ABX0TZ01_9SPHN|nr:alpha/beta hydrolase [Sphingomonas japonica]NIJ23543.1 pimeloyl-ACP methyl ester carboxylesterase [Sphingomonas japonica]
MSDAKKDVPWAGMALAAAGAVGGGLALWSAYAARGAQAMAPAQGRFVDVPGARLHYVDRGSGPVLLLVHGLLGNLRHFSYGLVDALAKDFRVIAVDRPGSGYSVATGKDAPDIAQQARIILAFADALGLDTPLLVGHSLGGAVALAAAVLAPDRFRGLALIAPLTQPIDTPPKVFAPLMVPPLLRGLVSWTLAVPAGTLNAGAAAQAVFAPEPVPADFATRGGGALAIRPATFRSASFELRSSRDAMLALVPRYAEMTVPISILYGRSDALLDPALHGEATAATMRTSRLELVDGGHMLPITQVERTAKFVREAHARA